MGEMKVVMAMKSEREYIDVDDEAGSDLEIIE